MLELEEQDEDEELSTLQAALEEQSDEDPGLPHMHEALDGDSWTSEAHVWGLHLTAPYTQHVTWAQAQAKAKALPPPVVWNSIV